MIDLNIKHIDFDTKDVDQRNLEFDLLSPKTALFMLVGIILACYLWLPYYQWSLPSPGPARSRVVVFDEVLFKTGIPSGMIVQDGCVTIYRGDLSNDESLMNSFSYRLQAPPRNDNP